MERRRPGRDTTAVDDGVRCLFALRVDLNAARAIDSIEIADAPSPRTHEEFMSKPLHPEPDRGPLIAKASLKAAELLGVSDPEFARIVGVSEGTVSSWKRGKGSLVAGSEQYRTALLFIRAYRSLIAIVVDKTAARA